MGSRAKLVGGTLGLSFLVLLSFLVHLQLLQTEQRCAVWPEEGQIALYIARGNYEQAYELLKRVDRENLAPRYRIRLLYQQAICERLLGRPARAYERLDQLQGALPVLEDYRRFWMARVLEEMGESEAAIEAYQDFALTSQHKVLTDSVYQGLASLYVDAKDYEQALRTYQRLLRRQPDQIPELRYHMARIHQERGDHSMARRMRAQLVEEYPAHHRALEVLGQPSASKVPEEIYHRAQIYLHHGHNRRAAKTLERFLRHHPRHRLAAEAQYQLGRAYQKDRQYARARKAFVRAYEHYQYRSGLYRLGNVLVRLNRETQAIETYEKFARLYPRHDLADNALWQAAKAAERNNKFAHAEKLYEKLSQNYADSKYRDEASWSVGFTHYCRHHYQEALETFQQASRKASQPHIVDQSLFWAGKAAERLDLEDEAQAYYAEAAKGFPRSYYSARATSLGFGHKGALQSRPQALLHPAPSTAPQLRGADHLQRAGALQKLGLVDLAEAELRQAEALNRGDTIALKTIRDRYENLGSLDRALRLSTLIFSTAGDRSEFHRLYPDYYWDQIQEAAREAQIDPYLVLSVIRQESSFREDAVSHAGAIGLMQIMPQTGRVLARQLGLRRFGRTSLFDPDVSIRLGSRFLGDQVRRFTEGPTRDLGFELGLAAYNAGPHVARKWTERFSCEDPDAFVERIPYKETRLYVKLVLKNYTIYKLLFEV